MTYRYALLLGISTTSLCLLAARPCEAQLSATQPLPPERHQIDERGIDLVTGQFSYASTDISIGGAGASGGLAYRRTQRRDGYDDNYTTGIVAQDGLLYVSIGDTTDKFGPAGGLSLSGTRATLSSNEIGYEYRTAEGVRYQFSATVRSDLVRVAQSRVVSITYPDGRRIDIGYDVGQIGSSQVSRPATISSNDGYRLLISHRGGGQQDGLDEGTAPRWMTVNGVVASNTAEQDCTISACFLDHPTWQRSRYQISGGFEFRTDAEGRTSYFEYDASGKIASVHEGGGVITLAYDDQGRITTYTKDGTNWTYAYSSDGVTQTTVVTGPSGLQTVATSDPARKLLKSIKVGTGGTRSFEYNAAGQVVAIIEPEGNRTQYTRDDRGNVTATTAIGKDGVPLSLGSATYHPCDVLTLCDKVTSTTDARGMRTDFGYGVEHGQVTSIQYRLPGDVEPRRQKTFAYQPLYAWVRDAAGSLVQASSAIYKMVSVRECSSGADCAGSAAETVTEIAYGAPGQPNNLLPTSVTVRAGDSSVVSTTHLSHDRYGDVVAIDGPLPGGEDTTVLRYNHMHEIVGEIGPDPDGAGERQRKAVRTTRDVDGRVTRVDTGTVAGTSDEQWSAFSVIDSLVTSYSPTGVKLSQSRRQVGSADLIELTQFGYDAEGRIICTARRATTSGDGSNPCLLASQSDEVRTTVYGSDGRVERQRLGATDVASFTYTANGLVGRVTDGNGNATSYGYDGFDRLVRTTYPDGTFDERTLAANGDPTAITQRDGSVISVGIDGFGQLASVTLPALTANSNLTFAYDSLGRLTSAANGNGLPVWTNSTTFAYDALGRLVSETSDIGGIGPRPLSYLYDEAGRRTRITWSDGFFASYEYSPSGELLAVRENGAAALATMSYDSLGRRVGVAHGNGTGTHYGYDSMSRLSSLIHYFTDPAGNVTNDFTYDLMSRLSTVTRSNDAYGWRGHVDIVRPYVANALNQYSSIAGAAMGYDARGNFTSDGVTGTTYSYDTLGHLVATSAGTGLAYDALGRLSYVAANGVGATRFGYAGGQLVSEYDEAGQLVRRHVPGDPTLSSDTPLVSYEGGARRYYSADERGSVVAISDDAGAATINRYDDYGIPGEGNTGRFQFTGQKWISELGIYDYKARMYSPTLGRFLQPDPIGYGDGLNLYAYAGSDPVNGIDPSGTTMFRYERCVYRDGYSVTYIDPGTGTKGPFVAGSSADCRTEYYDDGQFSDPPSPGPSSPTPGSSPAAPQPKKEDELRKKIKENEKRSRDAARKICARAVIEGGRDNAVGGAALAGAGAGTAFEAARNGNSIVNAPFPGGRLMNVLRPTVPGLLFGTIAGYVIGAVQAFSKEPAC